MNEIPNITHRDVVPAAEEILGLYFPVLDHGFVSLVDYMGGDEAVAQAARVSYGAGAAKKSDTRALLRYLHKHLHTSPAEMIELKFHCAMPIFVARQWIRHRTASVNEVSGRYSVLPMLFYTPPEDQLRPQSKTNKQGREGETLSGEHVLEAYSRWDEQRKEAVTNYEWFCENDFARELARIDLPLSTYTQWYWKIDAHNLMHFLSLRVDEHAQWEIRQFANVMAGMFKRVAPSSYEAWVDYDLGGARLSRMELAILRKHVSVSKADPLSGTDHTIASLGLSTGKEMEEGDMSKREVEEFVDLLARKTKIPNHDLDLATTKQASYFEAKALAAVPKVK